jgi:hypothetical protein
VTSSAPAASAGAVSTTWPSARSPSTSWPKSSPTPSASSA